METNKSQNGRKALLELAFGFLLHVIILVFVAAILQIPSVKAIVPEYFAGIVSPILSGLCIWLIFCRKEVTIPKPDRTNVYRTILVVLISLGAAIVLNKLMSDEIIPWDSISGEHVKQDESMFDIPLYARILAYCVAAPIGEEMLFRGLIYKKLRVIYSPKLAIFLSAAIFGIYHGNLMQGIYAFVMGALFAWAYEETGTFLAPVLMHAVANTIVNLCVADAGISQFVYSPAGVLGGLVLAALGTLFMTKWPNLLSKKEKQENS